MDPFTIASLVAAIAGAGIQYQAAQDAQRRQNQAIRESLQRQRDLQIQAEQKAMETANQFETPKREAEQQQIAETITQEMLAPVSESQAIRAEQQTTQGNVSGDYQVAKAKSDLETMKATEQLARLLGKTTSAGRLRLGEGIRMMDAGQAIDQLGSFSRGNQAADQIAIDTAGRVDPGAAFLGSLLQAGGTAGLMKAGSVGTTAGGTGLKLPASTGTGTSLAPMFSSPMSLKPGAGIGLKANGLSILG